MFLINGKEPNKKDLLSLFERKELLSGNTPFTTALAVNGKVPFWEHHLNRLKKSFEYLFPEESFSKLSDKLLSSLKFLEGESGKTYLRFTMIKGDSGIKLITQFKPFVDPVVSELKLKTVLHPRRLSSLPNFLKYGNYLESMMAVKLAKKEGFDDCLLLDQEGRAAEGTTANIFFRKGDRFFTPPLVGPVLDGVTRKVILEVMEELDFNCEELSPNRAEWENMDEAFVTSSTRGPVSISKIDTREFKLESTYFVKLKDAYVKKLSC